MNWEIKHIAPLELLNTGLKSAIDITPRWGYIIRCSGYRTPNADAGDLECTTAGPPTRQATAQPNPIKFFASKNFVNLIFTTPDQFFTSLLKVNYLNGAKVLQNWKVWLTFAPLHHQST
jgi:hypothetical protein